MGAPATASVGRDALMNRLHGGAVVLCAWLILTSPWVAMLRRIPAGAGFFDYAHVVTGVFTLMLAFAYLSLCVRGGRWRTYFPWASGQMRAAGSDISGLLRGRIPAAEGGGLFALIEGLLLLGLVAAGVTGLAWLVTQGSASAVAWRGYHVVGAQVLIGLIVVHAVTVALHLLEFIRN